MLEMTTTDDRSVIEKSACFPSSERHISVPQQLIEANELLKSINRRLEDCALEWQAEISRKQWQIFNSKATGGNLSEQSLLARTYFTEKNIDDAFQHLLSCNKIFSEYLKNFIDLLQGETNIQKIKEACNTKNFCFNTLANYKELHNTNIDRIQFPLLDNQHLNRESKNSDNINNITTVENSFTDVIKAKVNFDTKFLGFEAVLHKAISTTSNTICVCECCSNVMTTAHGKNKNLKHVTVNQRSRTIKKSKRLYRSRKTLSRKGKRGRPSTIIADAGGDQSSLEASASVC